MIPVETIPDEDDLYYRVPINLLKTQGGKLGPNCFRDPTRQGKLSTDWSKYATPEQTRAGMGLHKAGSYGVTALHVGRVRGIEALSVVHEPTENDDAHAHVWGLVIEESELKTQQRHELYDACDRRWVIAPGDPVVQPKPN